MKITSKKLSGFSTFLINIKIKGPSILKKYRSIYKDYDFLIGLSLGFERTDIPFSDAIKVIEISRFAEILIDELVSDNFLEIIDTATKQAQKYSKLHEGVNFLRFALKEPPLNCTIQKATLDEIKFTIKIDYIPILELNNSHLDKITNTPYLCDNNVEYIASNLDNTFRLDCLENTIVNIVDNFSSVDFEYYFENLDGTPIITNFEELYDQAKCYMPCELDMCPKFIKNSLLNLQTNDAIKIKFFLTPELSKYHIFNKLLVHPKYFKKKVELYINIRIACIVKFDIINFTDDFMQNHTSFSTVSEKDECFMEIAKLINQYHFSDYFLDILANNLLSDFPNLECPDSKMAITVRNILNPIDYDFSWHGVFDDKLGDETFNLSDLIYPLVMNEHMACTIIDNLNQNITVTQLIIESLIYNLLIEPYDRIYMILGLIGGNKTPSSNGFNQLKSLLNELKSLLDDLITLFESEIPKASKSIRLDSTECKFLFSQCTQENLIITYPLKLKSLVNKLFGEEALFFPDKFKTSQLYSLLIRAQNFINFSHYIGYFSIYDELPNFYRNAMMRSYYLQHAKKTSPPNQ
ncbi:MAG: hypothetical protein LBF12_06225 [Christensenellaceae bacterium]|jgi:hypothetical protein|nr:hypothetical protein [Christensenellaceae bacterium]